MAFADHRGKSFTDVTDIVAEDAIDERLPEHSWIDPTPGNGSIRSGEHKLDADKLPQVPINSVSADVPGDESVVEAISTDILRNPYAHSQPLWSPDGTQAQPRHTVKPAARDSDADADVASPKQSSESTGKTGGMSQAQSSEPSVAIAWGEDVIGSHEVYEVAQSSVNHISESAMGSGSISPSMSADSFTDVQQPNVTDNSTDDSVADAKTLAEKKNEIRKQISDKIKEIQNEWHEEAVRFRNPLIRASMSPEDLRAHRSFIQDVLENGLHSERPRPTGPSMSLHPIMRVDNVSSAEFEFRCVLKVLKVALVHHVQLIPALLSVFCGLGGVKWGGPSPLALGLHEDISKRWIRAVVFEESCTEKPPWLAKC